MLGALLILGFAIFLAFFEPVLASRKLLNKDNTKKYDAEIKKLWTIAKDSMNSRKTLRAEKALLTILKLDETNAAAYNRLGILYAKAQNYDEAIECFEIAQSLDNNPMSLHNVGLIYLETGAFEKATMAFLALAKAEEKLGHKKSAIEALESAYNLDKSTTTLRQILTIYEEAGDQENIEITTARIEQQIAADALKKAELEKAKKKEKKIKEPAPVRMSRPQPKIIYPRANTPIKALKKAAINSLSKTTNSATSKTKTPATRPAVAANQSAMVKQPAIVKDQGNSLSNTTSRDKKLSTTTSSSHRANKRPRMIQ